MFNAILSCYFTFSNYYNPYVKRVPAAVCALSGIHKRQKIKILPDTRRDFYFRSFYSTLLLIINRRQFAFYFGLNLLGFRFNFALYSPSEVTFPVTGCLKWKGYM